MIRNSPLYTRLLNGAAICSFLGAITTAILVALPNPSVTDFESSVLLYKNKHYITRIWILFIHPQVNIIAVCAIAILLFRKYPLRIGFGFFFLFIWALAEIFQQALLIDALKPNLETRLC